MHIVWFKKDGEWHCVEVYLKETADIVSAALKSQGFEVSDTSHDPRKYSVIN